MAVPQARAGNKWFTAHHYSLNSFPNSEQLQDLLKAVFVIAKGDGVISDSERHFFGGYLDAVGLPDSLHEFVQTYQGNDTLEHLLANSQAINDATKRVILYTAILVSGADGYADGEHAATLKAGAILGVSADVVNQLADQYRAEAKLAEARKALLFPHGQPW